MSPASGAAHLFTTLATLPSLFSLALTYPFLDGLPLGDIASLTPLAPLLATLACLSSTTPFLDPALALAPVRFLDVFAPVLSPAAATALPRALQILRLNNLVAGESAPPALLARTLARAGAARLRELWVPVEWTGDEMPAVEKWCQEQGVRLVRETFDEGSDDERRVFDEPWDRVVDRVERMLYDE